MVASVKQQSFESSTAEDVELREEFGEHPDLYLRAVLEACPSNVVVLDDSGTVIYVNGAWRRLALQRGLVHDLYGVGLNYLDICKQVSGASLIEASAIAEGINRILLRRRAEFQKEYQCHDKAALTWEQIHASRIDLPHAGRILVTHEDITVTSRASNASTKDEERLRLLLEVTNILPWEADVESGLFTYVGEQSVRMLGYPTEHWYETDFWSSHIHPDDREQAIADCLKYSQTLDNYEFEYRMIAKDGRTVWLHDIVSVVREDDRPKTIRGFMIDVTERKLVEEELRALSGRLISAQEEERKRIARELHDDLNQQMALLSIELEELGQEFQKQSKLRRRFENLQTQAREISAEIQRLSYRLHPSKLDHLGLAAAVKSLCKEVSERADLKVEFQQKGFPAAIPKEVSLCLFRIAQESLRNCIKHSGALKAQVVLERTERVVRISVSDDGRGFDTQSDAVKTGLGFTSMKERVRLVHGEILVLSHQASGTRIEASVPLTGNVESCGDGYASADSNSVSSLV